MVTSQQCTNFDRAASDLLLELTRISISSWYPGPRRGTPGAIENHIAGRWHIVHIQVSVEYFQHDDVTRQFDVTHFCRCAVLFSKHTFEADIEIKAVHIPTEKENCSGWVFEAVISKARFRRTPRNGKPHFTVASLHCQNTFAKKRSMALNIFLAVRTIMWQEKADIVAGDCNGASWRRKSGPQQQLDSTLEETFKNAQRPVPVGAWESSR